MKITAIPLGYLRANCYILEKNGKIIIIDPGDEYEKIYPHTKDKEIIKILITHYHPDHIGALKYFDENLILKNPKPKTYTFEPFSFEVIETKGHTKDSVTYYFKNEKTMFTGDFLFKENIGRTDMPTGSVIDMQKSIKLIKTYPDDIKIYPGHGEPTTLKREKSNNYFFKTLY